MKQNVKALEETMSKIRRCEPEVLERSCAAEGMLLFKFKNPNLIQICPLLMRR